MTNKPNPNLGEISHGPYYAAKMVPGDLGTKGGVRTDVHGRALRDDGSIIERAGGKRRNSAREQALRRSARA